MTRPVPTPARLAAALGGYLPSRGQRIGLLGGSFNPPHDGHLDISRAALARLALDRVWWLISPQNPLKPRKATAPLARRLATARALICDPRIVATPIEETLGTVYTVDTLSALIRRFPGVHFVWLMGADNFSQVDRWKDWQRLLNTLPIAIFDRPTYSLSAFSAKAARRFARHRWPETSARRLANGMPPAWVFIHHRLNPRSSTQIRAGHE